MMVILWCCCGKTLKERTDPPGSGPDLVLSRATGEVVFSGSRLIRKPHWFSNIIFQLAPARYMTEQLVDKWKVASQRFQG